MLPGEKPPRSGVSVAREGGLELAVEGAVEQGAGGFAHRSSLVFGWIGSRDPQKRAAMWRSQLIDLTVSISTCLGS